MNKMDINNDIERVLLSSDEIHSKIKELGEKISEEYSGKSILVICILKGSVVFFSDLIRYIKCDVEFDFMVVSSYGMNSISSNTLDIRLDLSQDIFGKDVLLVEDIIDSGNTLSKIKSELLQRNPSSLKIVTLLDKPDRRNPDIEIEVDYCGFKIPDEFVVGYGLDYAEKYRNIPYIGILKRSVYEK